MHEFHKKTKPINHTCPICILQGFLIAWWTYLVQQESPGCLLSESGRGFPTNVNFGQQQHLTQMPIKKGKFLYSAVSNSQVLYTLLLTDLFNQTPSQLL